MNPEELRKLIIQHIDLSDMSEAESVEVVDGLSRNIFKRVTIAAFDRLSEQGRAEFSRLEQTEDVVGMEKLLRSSIPNLEEFFLAEAMDELETFKKI